MTEKSIKSYFDDPEKLQLYVWELLKFSLNEPLIRKFKGANLFGKLKGFKERDHIHDVGFGAQFVEHFKSKHPHEGAVPKPDSLYSHYKHKALENTGKGACFYQILSDTGVAKQAGLGFLAWHEFVKSRHGAKKTDEPLHAGAVKAAARAKGLIRLRSQDAIALDAGNISPYAGPFRLLMAKYLRLAENQDSFDLLPASEKAKAFNDPKLSEFLRSAETSRNLPKGCKISNLYIICQKILGQMKEKGKIASVRGLAVPCMIKTLGWNPETGQLLSEEIPANVGRASVPAPPGHIDILRTTLQEAFHSSITARFEGFIQGDIGAMDCRSLSAEAILERLSATSAGASLVVVVNGHPDRIFRSATGRMGYSFDMELPNILLPDGAGSNTVLIITRSRKMEGSADAIEFMNGLTPAHALYNSIIGAIGEAKTQSDMDEILRLTDSVISHLESQKKKDAYIGPRKRDKAYGRLLSGIAEAHDKMEPGGISEGFSAENLRMAKARIIANIRKGKERALTHKDNNAAGGLASKR